MVPSGGHSGLVAADPQAFASPLLLWTAALHEWLTLDPAARPCLIAVSDDATKRIPRRVVVDDSSSRGRPAHRVTTTPGAWRERSRGVRHSAQRRRPR
ncbi:MAG: hypothetical protein MK486_19730 [Gemmatimonadetes bacterium]|nr:hypothetical protein [Gemmatimonadota bacterium]